MNKAFSIALSVSIFHTPIYGFDVGKHLRVCELTTGVAKLRP